MSFHPCSIIHSSIPLIRHSEKVDWPKVGDILYVRVSTKTYFYGQPVCQLADPDATDNPDEKHYWFVGICAEYSSNTAEINSIGTTIKFVSVAISGLAYLKSDNLTFTAASTKPIKL